MAEFRSMTRVPYLPMHAAIQQTVMTAQASWHTLMLDTLCYMGRITVMNMTYHLVATNPRIPRPVIDRFVGDTIDQFQHGLDLDAAGNPAGRPVGHSAPLTRAQTMQKLRDLVTSPGQF